MNAGSVDCGPINLLLRTTCTQAGLAGACREVKQPRSPPRPSECSLGSKRTRRAARLPAVMQGLPQSVKASQPTLTPWMIGMRQKDKVGCEASMHSVACLARPPPMHGHPYPLPLHGPPPHYYPPSGWCSHACMAPPAPRPPGRRRTHRLAHAAAVALLLVVRAVGHTLVARAADAA